MKSLALVSMAVLGVYAAEYAPGVRILSVDTVVENSFENDHCTSIIAGRKAVDSGSPVTTHASDCSNCDFRLIHVPAADYADGAMRPVYTDELTYPRYVGHDRGEGYYPLPGQALSEVRGHIPQVPHTYAYYDGQYGIMNEVGLAIGESTCMSRIQVGGNSTAMFGIGELTHVALERCDTARCAVQTMGKMAEDYGFYEPTNEGGETLTVIDGTEAWVFMITGVPDATSAVWVAQRVEDDHLVAIANWFTIGEIDLNNTDTYLASSNIHSVARELGFWVPEEAPFHFGKAYAPKHARRAVPYTARRVWRVQSLVDKANHYNSHPEDDFQNPFSIRVAEPVSVRDIMNITRDHYEGTEFDMTKGLAAGPFGTPNRPEFTIPDKYAPFERPISMYRASYSTVITSRSDVPDEVKGLLYFAPDAPHSSCHVPFYSGGSGVPTSFSTGSLLEWDMTPSVAWWVFDFLSNHINSKYSMMIPLVREKQDLLEKMFVADDAKVVAQAKQLTGTGELGDKLAGHSAKAADLAVKTWWSLLQRLVVRFNDNYDNSVELGTPVPYPDWYMDAVAKPANASS